MKNLRKAFTLIELVTVIAVIAILAAILIPTAGKALDSSKKAEASSALRQIATAYFGILNDSNGISDKNIYDWLGQFSKKSNINDPRLWIMKHDPKLHHSAKSIPKAILFNNENGQASDFNQSLHHYPVSFAIATGINNLSAASTTPIAWTRGLTTNGTWDPSKSLYGSKGGFIAFLDGHVEWFKDLNQDGGQLVHYVTKRPTANILLAIPPSASVLDYSGNIYNNKR